MSAQVFQQEFNVRIRRVAVSVPQRAARWTTSMPAGAVTAPGWLERLAAWAERQPAHHRMGSYMHRV